MDLFVYTFHHEGNIHRALSILDPAIVGDQGIPTESVLGEINALLPSMTPDQFEENAAFVTLLHQVVQQKAPLIPEYQKQVQVSGIDILPIVDLRAGKVTGEATQEDMIGQFTVRSGRILSESYLPNPAYKLLTDNGPLQLHPVIEIELLNQAKQCL